MIVGRIIGDTVGSGRTDGIGDRVIVARCGEWRYIGDVQGGGWFH